MCTVCHMVCQPYVTRCVTCRIYPLSLPPLPGPRRSVPPLPPRCRFSLPRFLLYCHCSPMHAGAGCRLSLLILQSCGPMLPLPPRRPLHSACWSCSPTDLSYACRCRLSLPFPCLICLTAPLRIFMPMPPPLPAAFYNSHSWAFRQQGQRSDSIAAFIKVS